MLLFVSEMSYFVAVLKCTS